MARREVRSEDVSGAIKESVMRAMLEAAVGEFFQAYAGTQILSSIFILKSSKVGYYHSAGTSLKGMELGTSPFLVYSAAKLLSKDGFRELNLGGAEPENPGLYRFKKGFGAVERRLEAAIFSLALPILHRARSALRLMRRNPKGFLRILIPEIVTKSKRIIRKLLPDPVIQKYRAFQIRRNLPERVRKARRQDFVGVPAFDPGPEAAILANLSWIGRAQDCSATADGGVARHFSLVNGWGPSYPETTGYIVPTMLAEAKIQDDTALRRRAERMLDWLVAIQLPEGAFQGGLVTHKPVVPVTFNTGQILLGLAAGARASRKEDYLSAMHRAATWLVETQDADGCWRRFPTPFAKISEKAYETHVSWSLFEAERVSPGRGYGEAGLKQVHWALTKQQDNSWFRDCCLNDPIRPLTHTIGYALRGVLEAYRLSQNEVFLDAGVRTADALIHCVKSDGFLAGRLDSHWCTVVDWVCLTGSVQIAYCWFLLFGWTGDTRYFDAGRKVNSYVRRTIAVEGDPDLVGGVRGSFPISGAYGNYEYLNWAVKFCIDSLRKEIELTEQGAAC